MTDSKQWYQSKTTWVSIIQIVVGFIGVLLGSEWIADNPDTVAWLVAANGLLQFVLRAITGRPISFGNFKVSAMMVAPLLLLPGATHASEVIVLRYSDPGRYFVQIDVNSSGQATVEQLDATEITLGTGSTIPKDPDPVIPGDPPESALGQIAFDEANKVNDPETASKLAALYQQVNSQLESGAIQSGDTAMAILRTLTDAMLAGKGDAWQPWRDAIGAELTHQANAGTLDYSTALADVARGLHATSNRMIDIRMIVTLVRIVVDARRRGELLSLETIMMIVQAIGGF